MRRGRRVFPARLCTLIVTKKCRKYINVYVHCSATPQGEAAQATKASRDQSQVHAFRTDSRSAGFPYLLTSLYLSLPPSIPSFHSSSPRCRCRPPSPSWARCPNAGLPHYSMHRFPGDQCTTQPHPTREGRPSSLGGCAQQGVVDGGDGLLCGLGPQPGRASQRGSHPLHNAHCSGYQHTAGVRWPLPTAHCPLSPFCFLPLHAVPRLVPGPR